MADPVANAVPDPAPDPFAVTLESSWAPVAAGGQANAPIPSTSPVTETRKQAIVAAGDGVAVIKSKQPRLIMCPLDGPPIDFADHFSGYRIS